MFPSDDIKLNNITYFFKFELKPLALNCEYTFYYDIVMIQ